MSRRPGLTVDRVVGAAVRVADRDGHDGLTLGAVADLLGVRTPSLYNHVRGLDDLRRLLTVRALRELGEVVQRAAVGRSADDAVRAIATACRGFALDHPGLYAATVQTTEGGDAEVQAAGAEVLATVLAALGAYGLDDDEAVHATRTLRSAVHGFVSLELAGGFGLAQDPAATFTWMIDRLAEAFTARAPGGDSGRR